MLPTDYSRQLSQAQQLAKLKIAKRCQTDLFFLCKYVLGYNLMTEATHGELCRVTQFVAPHSNPIGDTLGTPTKAIASDPFENPPKNSEDLDVHMAQEEGLIKEGLSNPDFSDTSDQLGVHNAISDTFDPNLNQLLLLMPRGTFKSSVVTIGFTIQMLLNDADARILIDSETFAKAKAFLAEIRGHLEGNEALREIYHTLYDSYPDDKKRDDLWTDSAINISARKRRRKEPSVSCAGVDVTKNGMHYDLIIMDDLHSEQNTANDEQIEKVRQHYKLCFSLLDPGQPLIVIGTRWTYTDVYQYILNNEAKNFNIFIRRAYNPDGSLFFPSRLTAEFLEKVKQTQGSYIFSCQYLNNPVDDESATFKRSNIVRIDPQLVEGMPINWYLSVDPSYEGPYSDYAALVIGGMNHTRDLYVKSVLRRKMTYSEIIDAIFDLYSRQPIKQIILETLAAQKSIMYELVNEQRRRGMWLPITEIKSRTKKKEERIRALAPFYEFGHIFHLNGAPGIDDLEYELMQFPKGEHDDCIDALATILEVAHPSGGGVERTERREKSRARIEAALKPRSPLTGV